MIATTTGDWPACFVRCQVGTGTNPVSRASGAVTFTQVANTVTASASFFLSGDVGRLLKYGTGTGGAEQTISSFTSSTSVQVSSSATVGAVVGTVWYTTDTALQTPVATGNTFTTGGAFNGTTLTGGNVVTMKRTIIFAAVGAPVTYSEIGFDYGANPLFDRDIISPGDSLTTGQQYQVQISVQVTYSPGTPGAVANIGTGINSAGSAMIECLNPAGGSGNPVFASIDSNGNNLGGGALDPGNTANCLCQVATATYTQNTAPAASGGGISGTLTSRSLSTGSYSTGSYSWTRSTTYPVGTFSGNIYGVGIGGGGTLIFDVLFTSPQNVPNTNSLQVTFTISWGRVLTN